MGNTTSFARQGIIVLTLCIVQCQFLVNAEKRGWLKESILTMCEEELLRKSASLVKVSFSFYPVDLSGTVGALQVNDV